VIAVECGGCDKTSGLAGPLFIRFFSIFLVPKAAVLLCWSDSFVTLDRDGITSTLPDAACDFAASGITISSPFTWCWWLFALSFNRPILS
jgi:hypothetical protein